VAEAKYRDTDRPLPDLSGARLRDLAERVRLPPEDRTALAAALRRMRDQDDSVPAVLMHQDNG
jgi:hypothetical protein